MTATLLKHVAVKTRNRQVTKENKESEIKKNISKEKK